MEYWNDRVGCLAGRIGVPACSLVRQLPDQHKHTTSGTGEDAYTPRLTTNHLKKVTSPFVPGTPDGGLAYNFNGMLEWWGDGIPALRGARVCVPWTSRLTYAKATAAKRSSLPRETLFTKKKVLAFV